MVQQVSKNSKANVFMVAGLNKTYNFLKLLLLNPKSSDLIVVNVWSVN